jgi:hypothetical protein
MPSSSQFTSQLHQQGAAVQTARANLNLAQRQVESLKAQRMSAEANVTQVNAQLRRAQVNLERTRILSPVDGYVTNLLAQPDDFLSAGTNTIAVVDANSFFWVDGYFEEANLAPIRSVRSRHRRCERAARHSGGGQRQPDHHVGTPARAQSARRWDRNVRHRTSVYLNNRLEQGHRGIKGRIRCRRGLKQHDAADRF